LFNGIIRDTISVLPHRGYSVTKADKILRRMRNNPRGWRIDDLKTLADRYGIDYRQPCDVQPPRPAAADRAGGQADKTDLYSPICRVDRHFGRMS